MEIASTIWRPIGELFLEKGLISAEQLERALAEQTATQERLGEILMKQNLISSPELTQALMEQLGREVAREEGFGTGLWAEINRRNSNPDAQWTTASPEPGRAPFGTGLTGRKLSFVPDEQDADYPSVADEAEFEELRASVAAPSTDSTPVQVEALHASLHDARLEITVLEDVVAERERRLASLESELDLLRSRPEGHVEGELDDVESLRSAFVAAETELRIRGARIDELEATLACKDDRLAELQQALVGGGFAEPEGSVTADVEEELELARARAAELDVEVSEANRKLTEMEATLAAELGARVELRQVLEAVERRDGVARQLVAEVERGVEGLKRERDLARSELEERERELESLRGRMTVEEAALAEGARTLEEELAASRASEALLQEQLAASSQELDALRDRLARTEASAASDEQLFEQVSSEPDLQAFLCFTPGAAGYRLVPGFGPLPRVGTEHLLDGVAHTVLRVGHSPLPFDSRPCAFLIAAPSAAGEPEVEVAA